MAGYDELVAGKFGMLEMELAAARYLSSCYLNGHFYTCHPTQFVDITNEKVLVGFCKLLEYGWFQGGTYNSEFIPTPKFIARLGL